MKAKEKKKNVFTPIPKLRRNTIHVELNEKEIQTAIVHRRQEYDEYIKSLNKPKPPKPKPKPKPKEYNIKKVNRIQKFYKGFSKREVEQIVNRRKINVCAYELLLLVLKQVLIHAHRRICYLIFKTYYSEPFNRIENEVDFNDKIKTKLSSNYYDIDSIKKNFNE